MTEMKRCSKCNNEYPAIITYFHKHGKGLRADCRKCRNIYLMKWRKSKNGRKSKRNTRLKSIYGITLKEYNKMLKSQNNQCKICGNIETMTNNGIILELSVDHDHNSGKIRGLLCNTCNAAIGLLQDDPNIIRKAAKYIEDNM